MIIVTWGPLTRPLLTFAHALARLYPYLYIETSSYRFSEDGGLLSYCHRRSKKKFGFSEATINFYSSRIRLEMDATILGPQWR